MRVLLATLSLVLVISAARGEEIKADRPSLLRGPIPVETLVGENLSYDIAFLWFDRLARGTLSLKRGSRANTYLAVLEARTLGVAAWVTKDRVQRYLSEMELGPDGRLRSLSFESQIVKGQGKDRKDRTSRYTFDYRSRVVRYQRAREGVFYKDVALSMVAEGQPNDILTACYNFRTGAFGPIKVGGHYVIPTFSRKGSAEILVDILPPSEWPDRDLFPRRGLLGKVSLDPEVFDTGGGVVYVWFDDYGRPARGIVENIVGIGDVRGKLRR